jgi:hypothetical protein
VRSLSLTLGCFLAERDNDIESRDIEAFKLALSLLSPPDNPNRGMRLLQRAFEAVQDRAELAERQVEELRAELARLKQQKRVQEMTKEDHVLQWVVILDAVVIIGILIGAFGHIHISHSTANYPSSIHGEP